MSGITVLSPVGINRVESRAVAPRVPTVEGLRLGLLNNAKPNAARLLDAVSQLIDRQHRLGGTLPKQKPNAAVGARGLDEYAREIQAALVAVGD